jgi:hypothetical protein
MTEPMNEERARLLCSPGRMIELNATPRHEPALDEFLIAKGYLERVEQEKADSKFIDLTVEELNKCREALEAADRMAELADNWAVKPEKLDESARAYRALRAKASGKPARAKIYPNPYRRRYIRPEPKPIRESVCIRCFKPFDSTAYNNLVNRVCQVCTEKLDKGEPGK